MSKPETFELIDRRLSAEELATCRREVDRLIGDLEAALLVVGLELAALELAIVKSPPMGERSGEQPAQEEYEQLALVDLHGHEEAASDMRHALSRPASSGGRRFH